jgi:release factor glutamine methyltransferase
VALNESRSRVSGAYVLFSTESDLDLLGNLISHAGFAARLVAERSILIESMIIYELRMQ